MCRLPGVYCIRGLTTAVYRLLTTQLLMAGHTDNFTGSLKTLSAETEILRNIYILAGTTRFPMLANIWI